MEKGCLGIKVVLLTYDVMQMDIKDLFIESGALVLYSLICFLVFASFYCVTFFLYIFFLFQSCLASSNTQRQKHTQPARKAFVLTFHL